MTDAEIARLKAEAAKAKADAARAEAEAAEAALAAALAAAGTTETPAETPQADSEKIATPEAESIEAPAVEDAPATSSPSEDAEAVTPEGTSASEPATLSEYAGVVAEGYSTENALQVGVLLEDGEPVPNVPVTLPLEMLNRHGLIAGATGTGKTRTLQLIAEGLSSAGVPTFLTDIKGDLTGVLEAGPSSEGLLSRTAAQGQPWVGKAFPTEMFALGDAGNGVPVRATVTDFGPLLLARVLGLNDTQESALSLIFSWADSQGLALVDLQDLRSVINYLTDQGKDELKTIGGIAPATAGVILREIAALQAQGGDGFFGETAFDPKDFFRTTNGLGVINLLELPELSDRPALFSTFVMWLLAELFEIMPEVGDVDKPKLVFFFDEAHLLFKDATSAFLNAIITTVRLIRSKGIGIFFITQTPKDVPGDVLAQLGAKVQHALRAHTPNDQKALRETVKTFPTSPLDLEELLPNLGTGEAIVTVLDKKGRPSPVAPTKLWAPAGVMGPASQAALDAHTSEFTAKYAERIDPESAHELLEARIAADQAKAEAEAAAAEEAKRREAEEKEAAKEVERQRKEAEKEAERLRKQAEKEREAAIRAQQKADERAAKTRRNALDSFVRSASTAIGREITRSIFGNRRR